MKSRSIKRLTSTGWSSGSLGKGFAVTPVKCLVITALLHEDGLDRLEALTRLRACTPAATLKGLIGLLDTPGQQLRRRAGRALLFFRLQPAMGEAVARVTKYLGAGEDPRVRLSCALALMPVKTPAVTRAFLGALQDPFYRVVQLACETLGARGGTKAIAALMDVLKHPSWRVRLETCKALMVLKAADDRVVACLEGLCMDSKAAAYNAEIAALNRLDAELEAEAGETSWPCEHWQNLETMLVKARKAAARPARKKA